jgi:hypothetical protein
MNLWIGKMSRETLKKSRFKVIDEQHKKVGENQMILVYPQITGIMTSIWSGPLNRASADLIWNSSYRKEIVDELTAGTSAIFYYLESGNADSDNKIKGFLQKGFEILENGFELPETVVSRTSDEIPDDPSNRLRTDVPFKLEFKLKSLPAKGGDPLLRKMLHGLEPGHPENEPMAFAIFGRGRVIGPITGADLNHETLIQLGGYLCGRCSCQVKAQNPGSDILLNNDWDNTLFSHGHQY